MKRRQLSKKSVYYFIVGLCMLLLIARSGYYTYKGVSEQRIQEDIAKEIIRFHIIANSDKETDQKLKLEVKEQVVSALQKDLKNARNVQQAREIILSDLDKIEDTALMVMKEKGYSYSAHAYLANSMFPIKIYGDMVFPAGEYQALRVELGDAEGKNWWCVMFPTLCFVDGTYSVVPDESKEELRNVLPEEDYKALLLSEKGTGTVKVQFKLVEWWKKLMN